MISEEIRRKLYELQDISYRDFQANLIPNIAPESIIGVRTPTLRKLEKELRKNPDIGEFLQDLPHTFFDENQLHAFIISEIKEYTECLDQIRKFLPHIDNWATCDQLSPKVFGKQKTELLTPIREWIRSDQTYPVRFAIRMLMQHYLDDNFDPEYLQMVSAVRSEEYYINMMIAWYFATALAKRYNSALPYIEQKRLEIWTHNKTIQKAIESCRITPEQKDYLRNLKIKGRNVVEPALA